MVVGGAGASASGSKVQINQLGSGRIPGGALVERSVEAPVGGEGMFTLELNRSDFGTAQRAVEAINRQFGPGTARRDGRPRDPRARARAAGARRLPRAPRRTRGHARPRRRRAW